MRIAVPLAWQSVSNLIKGKLIPGARKLLYYLPGFDAEQILRYDCLHLQEVSSTHLHRISPLLMPETDSLKAKVFKQQNSKNGLANKLKTLGNFLPVFKLIKQETLASPPPLPATFCGAVVVLGIFLQQD